MRKHVEINSFVRRQTLTSRFSHYEPSADAADGWAELETLITGWSETARSQWTGEQKVLKIAVPDSAVRSFYTGVVRVDESTEFRTTYAPRPNAIKGEAPYISSVAMNGDKAPAAAVDIILYHRSALQPEELTYTTPGGEEILLDGEWQVISINARDTTDPEPPTPQAMARNTAAALGLPEGIGGTPRHYTEREWVVSILYWSQRTMCVDR